MASSSKSSSGEVILDSPRVGKKQVSPAKKWCFTYNSPIEDWKTVIVPKFQEIGDYIIGEEVGDSGTFHLQGFIEAKNKLRPMSLGLPKEIHWEACKGTRADNIKYCSKDGKYTTNIRMPRPLPVITLYGWQLDCQKKFEAEPDNRTIHWFWSKEGGRGKSSMVRWMVRNGAIVCAGKAANMKYMIVKVHEKQGVYPDNIVFDVPRSMENYISYTGIEEIKNAVFASTKYECEPVEMPYPNVFVFANFPPDLTDRDMSRDRFVVVNVDDHSEEAIYECLRPNW